MKAASHELLSAADSSRYANLHTRNWESSFIVQSLMIRSLLTSATSEASGLGKDLGLLPGYVKATRVVLGIAFEPFLGRLQGSPRSSACGRPTVVSMS